MVIFSLRNDDVISSMIYLVRAMNMFTTQQLLHVCNCFDVGKGARVSGFFLEWEMQCMWVFRDNYT